MPNIDSRMIYRQLKQEIIMMDRLPGELMSENAVSKQFHISRTPVREIFKWLEMDGLVDVVPQKGTFVSRISMVPLYDLMFIRESTEKLMFEELIRKADQRDIFTLKLQLLDQSKILEKEQPREQLVRSFLMADNRFHQTMYTLIGREGVWDFISTSRPQYNRFRILNDMLNQDTCEKIYARHTQIVAMVEERNLESLYALSKDPIYNSPDNILNVIEAYPKYFLLDDKKDAQR